MKMWLIDGFQSRDKTAMLVNKTMTHVLHNSRIKFPKDFFSFVQFTNMAARRQVKTIYRLA